MQVYGYADFEPGLRVSADFTVQTSGSSYIPTGVEIEYYYQITDVNGHTVETTPWSFEYRDPRYQWESLTIGSLTVLWHDLSERRVAQAAQQVAARIEEIKPVFGVDDVHTMKAVIVNGSREARRSFPFVSDASRRGHYFAGFAFDEYDLFLIQGLDTDTMIHEATHLLVHQAADSALARVPAWLNEGLAMQFEDSSIVRSATVRSAARGRTPAEPEKHGLGAWEVARHLALLRPGLERGRLPAGHLRDRADFGADRHAEHGEADRRSAAPRLWAVGRRAGPGVAERPSWGHASRSQARSRHHRHVGAADRGSHGGGRDVGMAVDMAVAPGTRAVGPDMRDREFILPSRGPRVTRPLQ